MFCFGELTIALCFLLIPGFNNMVCTTIFTGSLGLNNVAHYFFTGSGRWRFNVPVAPSMLAPSVFACFII